MHRRTLAALAVLVALCGPAAYAGGGAEEKAQKVATAKEWKRLEGTWEFVSEVFNGREVKLFEGKKHTLTVRGEQGTVELDGKVLGKWALRVDPTKKPKAWDFVFTEGRDKGKTLAQIYELKGDELRMCGAGQPGLPRPTGFTSEPGSRQLLITYRRVKDTK